jgi:hypothetical protein
MFGEFIRQPTLLYKRVAVRRGSATSAKVFAAIFLLLTVSLVSRIPHSPLYWNRFVLLSRSLGW